ncbi:autotransporter outer membrane beta-barrel domain-containing protein [Microbulbifer agarilyticus]|uniref:autotransporter family protein n=1 Tax=Microbulbifer agarilyticus TaxID=260552 RepID=UPI001C972B76|nr:autotransporter outer membrane beta-barrel domain-containing protein [Microbulbifer agarilyticus]MBY6190331.1 autotransporter outer membrane beta-barrel domain-containing protein [Microbulbifer agarilyticus]
MSSDTRPHGPTAMAVGASWVIGLIALLLLPTPAKADCSPGNIGTEGPDTILCDTDNDAAGADVDALGGDDVLNLDGGTIGIANAGTGDDQINVNGAVIETNLFTGDGNDTVIVENRDSQIGNFFNGGLDTGDGDDRIEIYDGLTFRLNAGAGDDSLLLDGGFIFEIANMGAGDDTFYYDEGIINHFVGGSGSDYLEIDARAFDEEDTILDGGDDATADDGDIDTLRFKLDHLLDGSKLLNWENLIINGSSKLRMFNDLTVGGGRSGGESLGLDIRFGGILEPTDTEFSIFGDVQNAGTLDLENGVFNQLNIATHDDGRFGSYHGRDGRLWMDTQLAGDNAPSDFLSIAGNASGRTFVGIFNLGGNGALTVGDGIPIIQVEGNNPRSAFTLAPDYTGFDGRSAIVGGAYGYTLHRGGIDGGSNDTWFLRSTISNPFNGSGNLIPRWQPGAVLYETYAQSIRRMNTPTTLRKRVGNRFWAGTSFRDRGTCCYGEAVERTIDGGGWWMRLNTEYNDNAPEGSTAHAEWQQDFGQVQIGSDFSFDPAVYYGRMMLGVFAQYGSGSTELDSFFGRGDIDTDYFGVGASLTWHGSQGSYADIQAQFNWFDSDLYSSELWYLGKDNDAVGFNFSVEGGHSLKLCDFYSLTPQLQLAFTAEDIDDNQDPYGASMTDAENQGGFARMGVAFEQRLSQRVNRNMYGNLLLERIGFYAIANTYFYFDDQTEVKVSGTSLFQERDQWWGQIGAGFTYDECGDGCSVYGELDYATSLNNLGDSYSVQLTFGFRYKW